IELETRDAVRSLGLVVSSHAQLASFRDVTRGRRPVETLPERLEIFGERILPARGSLFQSQEASGERELPVFRPTPIRRTRDRELPLAARLWDSCGRVATYFAPTSTSGGRA